MIGRVAALCGAALIALGGCRPAGEARPVAAVAAPPSTPVDAAASHELGRKIWNYRCYFCHGYSGDSRTLASTYLNPPPRDFTATPPDALPVASMRQVVSHGKPGTAMKGFQGILGPAEIDAVIGFVRREFMHERAVNTRYHTVENGWPDHQRYAAAFPFARGEIPLDTPWEQLTPEQQEGKRLFHGACITCHDHARVRSPGAVWETRAISYPRDAYCTSCHDQPLGPSGPRPANHPPPGASGAAPTTSASSRVASTYLVHDRKPELHDLDVKQRLGESLYQKNCAFCHAADGTAKSWIGRFLEPHPRDLTDPAAMSGMTRERLTKVIEDGIEGSSMPGWKSVLNPAQIAAIVAYIHRAFHPIKGEG